MLAGFIGFVLLHWVFSGFMVLLQDGLLQQFAIIWGDVNILLVLNYIRL